MSHHYRTLLRWHIWLGWLIGIPLILWTASGLFMAARPIDAVRGTDLMREPLPLMAKSPVAPVLSGRPVEKLSLEQRADGPVWIIQYMDGGARRARASDGVLLPPVTASEAAKLAESYHRAHEKPVSYKRFAADHAPLDLRKARPSWQASYLDGTHLYIDADSGAKLAIRTRYWRIYDFMWGLHIMDLQTREESSHITLIGFAAMALLALLMAFWMLIARQTSRSKLQRR
jgi:hypothetical protein